MRKKSPKTISLASNRIKNEGFTILELIAVSAITSVVALLAIPAMNNYFEKNRLKNAAETLYSQLQLARSESIKRFTTTYVNFSANGSSTWSLGISDTAGCVSTKVLGEANDCTLLSSGSNVLHTTLNTAANQEFPDINMTAYSDTAMSIVTNPLETNFEPVRGTAVTGAVKLASPNGWTIHAIIYAMGNIDMCSPLGNSYVPGYSSC